MSDGLNVDPACDAMREERERNDRRLNREDVRESLPPASLLMPIFVGELRAQSMMH